MTPTIVAKDGKLVAVVGSPGGRTIINTVMEVVLNLLAFDMPIQDAVNAARIHHQWLPNVLTVERGMPQTTIDALTAMGHTVRVGGQQGTAHSIAIDAKTGKRLGAADPRDRDAGARGY
jgi:gamma-glutamyltranspeptidase/glutathione hydrolase